MSIPVIDLGGVAIPQLGLGVYQLSESEAEVALPAAFEAGYRHIDTAKIYQNEAAVGAQVRASGLRREEIFVTTKVWNDDQGYERTLAAADTSLMNLGLDYLDLYLIHWPTPAFDTYVDSWRALIHLRDVGKVRAIGVSNFHGPHLERLVAETGVVPVINQIELSPYFQQRDLRQVHERFGIVTQSWSPLARGGDLLADPVICSIASKYGVLPSQVVLRWHIQSGFVVIPKSAQPERIRSNGNLWHFSLDADDLQQMDALDRGHRTGPNPDDFNFVG